MILRLFFYSRRPARLRVGLFFCLGLDGIVDAFQRRPFRAVRAKVEQRGDQPGAEALRPVVHQIGEELGHLLGSLLLPERITDASAEPNFVDVMRVAYTLDYFIFWRSFTVFDVFDFAASPPRLFRKIFLGQPNQFSRFTKSLIYCLRIFSPP